VKLLLFLLVFQVQPDLPTENQRQTTENQRQIERLEDRIYAMERQLDRVENTVNELREGMSQVAEGAANTDILLYIVMAIFGVDKAGYWIRRRNGRLANSKGGKE
jgi:septal ring factor EnvC (AmiA/AmiB activator)